MTDRTFGIFSEPPALDRWEQGEVEREIARLRTLLANAPGQQRVAINTNPSGVLGDYVGLLLDAATRGVSRWAMYPLTVRLLYGRQRWFIFAREAQEAFVAALSESAGERTRR